MIPMPQAKPNKPVKLIELDEAAPVGGDAGVGFKT